jgi:DNA-binding response OmpR family regulator
VIDRDIHKSRALVIEGNALLRSVTAGQLRNLGIGHVSQAPRPRDARVMIEREAYDIIICNREFDGLLHGGQDLLDELRRENQLTHSTVFLMITSEAHYHHVIEAAEANLDGILVTPFNASALEERLGEARLRKRELADLLRALDGGKLEMALALATQRWQENRGYATYCGRIVAELLLRLQRPEEAIEAFERLQAGVKKGTSSSWATLGRARGHLALGDVAQARRLIAEVQNAEPHNADAHDLMGRIQVELCDLGQALANYLRSAELTPGCLLRSQHTGALAFYEGQSALALKMLERSVGLGVQSKLFDALTLSMIAMLRYDAADAQGVASSLSQIGRYRERYPESRRLMRLEQSTGVLAAWIGGAIPDGMATLREMSARVRDDGFDLEGANLLLGLWSRAPLSHFEPTEYEDVLDKLAMRFCTSKAIAEVLAAAAKRSETATVVLQRCQTRITSIAEKAMDHALRGQPGAAMQQLLRAGQETLNAKLLEMCVLLTRRHGHSAPEAESIAASAAALLKRCCSPMTHIAGIQRTGRSPGGMQLRGRAGRPGAAVAAAAAAAAAGAPAVPPGAAPAAPGAAAQAAQAGLPAAVAAA